VLARDVVGQLATLTLGGAGGGTPEGAQQGEGEDEGAEESELGDHGLCVFL
jgi:hypothetical protein